MSTALTTTTVIKLKEKLKEYNATGVVLWFKALKGYGFILETKHGRTIFVHHANIKCDSEFKKLDAGDIVECAVELTSKGWAAVKVIKTGSSEVRYAENTVSVQGR